MRALGYILVMVGMFGVAALLSLDLYDLLLLDDPQSALFGSPWWAENLSFYALLSGFLLLGSVFSLRQRGR
jgi:hypothetical protein